VANNDKEDDLYDLVTGMADRLKLEGSERSKYVHDHMTRGGYKAVPNYVLADDDDKDDKDSSPFFGGGGRKRSRSRSRSDDDDWYAS
jgi:hypothetical protein